MKAIRGPRLEEVRRKWKLETGKWEEGGGRSLAAPDWRVGPVGGGYPCGFA